MCIWYVGVCVMEWEVGMCVGWCGVVVCVELLVVCGVCCSGEMVVIDGVWLVVYECDDGMCCGMWILIWCVCVCYIWDLYVFFI